MIAMCLIVALVGGLVLAFLIKLIFNKVTGANARDDANLRDFLKTFGVCFTIILVIMISIVIESHM